jgi:hypothetical protein
MLRDTHGLTDMRTVLPYGKLGTLPRSCDRITPDHQPYAVDRVAQEEIAAGISVRVAP